MLFVCVCVLEMGASFLAGDLRPLTDYATEKQQTEMASDMSHKRA